MLKYVIDLPQKGELFGRRWNENDRKWLMPVGQVSSADPADVADVQKIHQIQNPRNSFDIR